jgi:cytochrome oxidase Cu insertion factor (SCO1/SenC/PrrC family)
MKIDGVYDVASGASVQYVTVTYDPEKTSVQEFEKALSKEQFFVRGEPEFLK